MSIFLFPFAGGNKYCYKELTKQVAGTYTLEYAGRGSRIREPLMSGLEQLVEDAFTQLKAMLDRQQKYKIYGHSMGAMIGYLLCHKLVESQLPLPEKLIVSGRKSPAVKRTTFLSRLPDEAFWQEIVRMGGVPEDMMDNPELINYFLPILKADFMANDGFQYKMSERLPIPIDVFYGSEEGISEEDIAGWKNESSKEVNIKQMDGNHFFIFNHAEWFSTYFKQLL